MGETRDKKSLLNFCAVTYLMIFQILLLIALSLQVAAFVPSAALSARMTARRMGLSMSSDAALMAFKKKFGNVKEGSRFSLDEKVLESAYTNLSKTVGGEAKALEIVEVWPEVLTLESDRINKNFNTYSNTYGVEEATGMLVRNPALFAVPTEGYGSAEKAAGDAMAMSYVIAFTRPIGGILLSILGLALLKGVIFGPGLGFPSL